MKKRGIMPVFDDFGYYFIHNISSFLIRDGPLEKLWVEGGGGGGVGNFPAAGIFFCYQILCMNFFRP